MQSSVTATFLQCIFSHFAFDTQKTSKGILRFEAT